MKKVLVKTAIFIIVPSICWALAEVLLPSTFFTFRHYEALSFDANVAHISGNYPNVNSRMDAVGDLCHHTENAIVKNEQWITDKIGYRNDSFIENPDVVFIGDSFIQGSSLDQSEILSNQIAAYLPNKKVYNMAPASFNDFDYFLKNGIIKKPKLIVFELVERYLPAPILKKQSIAAKSKQNFAELLETGNINVLLSKIMKAQSVEWARSRIHASKGKGIRAYNNQNMFFLQGTEQHHPKSDLTTTAQTIISYKKYCDLHNIEFIFLPMPDKETVYFDMVPFAEQPDYLIQLDSILRRANVQTVNTVELYNEYRVKNKTLLYHLDDTHWNANATSLVGQKMAVIINKKLNPNTKK